MLALLALITALLIGTGLKVIEHRLSRRKSVTPEPLRNVILPSELKQEDFDWFCWSMEMAGLDPKRVVNTCSCGFAQECYMHCNHELNDGKCTGHAYKPMTSQWGVRFIGTQTPDLISWQDRRKAEDLRNVWHRATTVPETEVNAFKQKMLDRRAAKMKAEATPRPVRNPAKDIEDIRRRMDERHIKVRDLQRVIHYSAQNDAYMLQNGRVITRQTLEDLTSCGRLEEVYEFGSRQPVAYLETPPDTSWIKTERV